MIVSNRVIDHREDPAYTAETKRVARGVGDLLGVEQIFYGDLLDEQLDGKLIDVIVPIERVVAEMSPDIAYVPNADDPDQDHRAVANACRVACRWIDKVLAYEVPGTSRGFAPNVYLDVRDHLQKKIEAMKRYAGEMRPYPHPRSEQGLEVYARYRGMEAQLELAEAFILLKQITRTRA